MPPSPPDNGAYMVAAYIVTAVILVVYAAMLWRRARAVDGDQ
ncbi:MAG TPA: hypothetical protein VFU46_08125 [Gemmatimonadales bacterium]|nr:hypothetical protein [Gemmatimonadales bacterium]